MNGHELDFALGYFTIFPYDFKTENAPKNEPYLFISPNCPEDIKQRLVETWDKIKIEIKKQYEQGEGTITFIY